MINCSDYSIAFLSNRIESQLLDEWPLLAFARSGSSTIVSYSTRVLITSFLGLFLSFCKHGADLLMFFPLAQLAVAGAVPGHLASRASLCRQSAAFLALGILHEVLEDIAGVELNEAIHVSFLLSGVLREERLGLLLRQLAPVPVGEEARAYLGQGLYHEGVRGRDSARVAPDAHFFKAAQHVRKHWKLIQ
mmetsp:Transcript_292/g.446  ORF Transcript_292/g.446 Transcript_292/m.446 type:complete len:191 (+) Transcript_292:77-649(+)